MYCMITVYVIPHQVFYCQVSRLSKICRFCDKLTWLKNGSVIFCQPLYVMHWTKWIVFLRVSNIVWFSFGFMSFNKHWGNREWIFGTGDCNAFMDFLPTFKALWKWWFLWHLVYKYVFKYVFFFVFSLLLHCYYLQLWHRCDLSA